MATVIEAEIFSRVIDPSNPTLTPEAARAVLQLGFRDRDHERMAELAAKSNEATLSEDEHRELDGFVFVGDVPAMLKSKACASLQRQSPAA